MGFQMSAVSKGITLLPKPSPLAKGGDFTMVDSYRWPWYLQAVLSHTAETKRIQQTCEGQHMVKSLFFFFAFGCAAEFC